MIPDLVLALILVYTPIMWLILLVTTCFVIYIYLSRKLKYWEKLGVKYREPNLLLGNLASIITLKESIGQTYTSLYNEFENVPYIGYYKIHKPGILLRDAELVKNVMIRDFDSFGKNDIDVDDKIDPLMARNPFCKIGDAWKISRNQITPAFSSGKMKLMFPLMEEVTKKLSSYIARELHVPLEARELCAKFTTDNVASCAFGLDSQSFEDADSEFRKMGNQIFDQSIVTGLKIMIGFILPAVSKLLKIQFIPSVVGDYFRIIVEKTLKYRSDNNIVRNDFLDMMQQLKIKQDNDISTMDITSYAVGFFGDGFQTSSSAMSFALYCIAKHKDIQDKLRLHINNVLGKHDGKFSYDAVQDMSYLDMALQESMRRYPPVMALTKVCTKPYTLPASMDGGKEVTITPGMPVAIPVYALHNDNRYFPNPNKYDPERFSEENKANIQKGSYLPFGEGPRICLGQRFGFLQVKVGLAAIIKEYIVTVNQKTSDPLQIDPKAFITGALDGMWLDFKKI